VAPFSTLSFCCFFVTWGERTEGVWGKSGKSEGLSNRRRSSERVPTHSWRLEKREITQRSLAAMVHRHVSGQGPVQPGAGWHRLLPGLEETSGTEPGNWGQQKKAWVRFESISQCNGCQRSWTKWVSVSTFLKSIRVLY